MTIEINDLEIDEKLDLESMNSISGGSSLLISTRSRAILDLWLDRNFVSTKSAYSSSRELQRKALTTLVEHVERQTQVIQKITS